MATIADVRRQALAALRPPPRLKLAAWLEAHVRLPEGTTALPGPLRLWPYQRELANAIGDPTLERVTVVKSVRIGYSLLLAGAVASFVSNDPAPILLLLPTEADARDTVVSDLEPLFAATPAVAGTLSADVEEGARNTLLHRRFAGGSVVSSSETRHVAVPRASSPVCYDRDAHGVVVVDMGGGAVDRRSARRRRRALDTRPLVGRGRSAATKSIRRIGG